MIERVLGNRQDAPPRARGLTVGLTTCRVLLAAVVVVLIVGAYYPFSWNPPRTVHNQVTRVAGGALRFGTMNQARTPGTPAWLAAARRSGDLGIQLEAETAELRQRAPVLMLASDTWHVDFAIVQADSRLAVWVLRPGSHTTGRPAFAFPRILHPHKWFSVDVQLSGDDVRIAVDGGTPLVRRVPGGVVPAWRPGQVSLGDSTHGGLAWQGEVRLAEVRTGNDTVNYASPGALPIPRTFFYLPDHVQPFPPTDPSQWLLALVDLLTFIPAGFLIVWSRRRPMHPVPAALITAALAVVLAAGKFLFYERHTSVANVLGQAIGGLLGALLAWWLARAGRQAWLRRG